jgi:hypothetical protein
MSAPDTSTAAGEAMADKLENWQRYGASGMGKTLPEVTSDAAALIRSLCAENDELKGHLAKAVILSRRVRYALQSSVMDADWRAVMEAVRAYDDSVIGAVNRAAMKGPAHD